MKGQIWVETAIYTLIAFALIGAVLAFAKPKIEEIRDRTVIEQSIEMLKIIDNRISYIGIPGNQRLVILNIKEGTLIIDGINDSLFFEIESRHQYSEENLEIANENLRIMTLKESGINKVRITSNYSSRFNITFEDEDKVKTITKSSTPYDLIIYKGELQEDGRHIINFIIK
jgi:hypothetical protein